MSTTFAEYVTALLPTFVRGPWGRRWGAATGAALDGLLGGAKAAAKAGFVILAPSALLPLLAGDVRIDSVTGESDSSLRARIRGAWESWSWAGTSYGVTVAVGLMGYGTPILISWHQMHWDADSTRWSRGLLVFTGRATYGASSYGSVTYGGRQVQAIEAADPAVVRPQLRRVLRKWINARDRIERVIIARGGARYGEAVYGLDLYATESQTLWGAPIYGDPDTIYGDAAFGVFC